MLGKSGVLKAPSMAIVLQYDLVYVGVTCRKFENVHIDAIAASSFSEQLPFRRFALAVS